MFRITQAVRPALGLAAATLAAVTLAACGSDVLAPATKPPAPSALVRAAAALVPNRLKYSDAGAHAATGGSGSASLTIRALLSRSGDTELDVTTGALDDAAASSSALMKVQVQGFTAQGAHLFTDNYNRAGSSATFHYDGLVRGARLEVQAVVRGAGARQAEVVAVADQVVMRPDLAIGSLLAPPNAHMGTPVNIAATVREMNGDVGATADCLLAVDGAVVDRAPGIWVDAGGLVTCAFTQVFPTAGVRRVEVRLANAVPRDDDPGNDAATGAIEITSDPYQYSAWARDLEHSYTITSSMRVTRLSDGQVTEGGSSLSGGGHDQASGINAQMSRALSFPLTRVEVAQSTGGVVLHEAAYDGAMPNAGSPGCFSQQYTPNGAGRIYLCVQDGGTTVQYLRWAGDVSYHSESYSRTWDAAGNTVGTPVYTRNGSATQDGTIIPFRDDLTIRVSVEDDGAVYNTLAVVPLRPYTYRVEQPLRCTDLTNSQRTTAVHSCSEMHWLDTGVTGTVSAP